MSLSTLAVCCAVGLLTHPFNSFTILSWNQPASFVAAFARRRIENVGQFFQKELPEVDAFNTRQYYWFYASMRAWNVGMIYRGVLMWTGTGGFSLSPFVPGFIQKTLSFIKNQITNLLNRNKNDIKQVDEEQEQEDDDQLALTQTTSFQKAREEILLKTEADNILGYTLNFSTATLVRSTFRASLSALTSILSSPLQVVITIFVADISNGYPNLKRAWKGFHASTLCDWDRDHPPYKPGDDPWIRNKPRPSLPYLVWAKLSKSQVFNRTVLPFAKYAAAHSLVSSLVQWFESYVQRRKFLQRLDDTASVLERLHNRNSENEDEDNDENNNTTTTSKQKEENTASSLPLVPAPSPRDTILDELSHELLAGTTSSLIFLTNLTPMQKIKRILLNSGHFLRVFAVSAVLHGLVSYNMSQPLSTAVQNICKMTDYAQPYQAAGGLCSVSDPLVLRVPKISLFFAVTDGLSWGLITSIVATWR